jgi:trigger factor
LKIETTPREDHQVRIVAEFEPEFMEKFKRQAAKKISQDSRIPGFRPGKAPYEIVRRAYGEDAIRKEAVELMLDEVYPGVIKEADIKPSGPGDLEEIISYEPPKFAFVIPLMPSVELGDYKSIRKDYAKPEVTEEQIDQVIKNLRANYSTAEPVERPAQEGDLVSVKIKGTLVNPAEGEEPEVFKENTVQMIVGENEFEVDDWPYEGFTRELIGLKTNEEKSVTHSYPQDYDEENLKGKEVNLEFTVASVKSLTFPELNDEFAQTLGEYSDVAALRESVRQNLKENDEREYENNYFTELMDQIIAVSTIKYPPQVLQEEEDRVLHSLEHDLEDRKMDLPTYLKTLNKDQVTFMKEDIEPVAKRRLERSLAMDELARVENVQLDVEQLQKMVEANMQMYAQNPEVAKLNKAQAQNFTQNLTMDTAARMLNQAVMKRIKAIANNEPEEPLASEMDETTSLPASESSSQEEPVEVPAEENPADAPAEEKSSESGSEDMPSEA